MSKYSRCMGNGSETVYERTTSRVPVSTERVAVRPGVMNAKHSRAEYNSVKSLVVETPSLHWFRNTAAHMGSRLFRVVEISSSSP